MRNAIAVHEDRFKLRLRSDLLLISLALIAAGCSTTTPAPKDRIPVTTKSPEARSHYEKALTLSESFRIPDAIEELNAALELDPGFVSASALLAFHTPARPGLERFEQVMQKLDDLPEAEQTFIRLLHARWGGDTPAALVEARKLVELVPESPRAHTALGEVLATTQEHDAAVSEFQKAIALNPQYGPALNMHGYTLLQLGRMNDAIAAFQRYVTANPNEPNAYDSLGDALLAAGRYSEAEAAFRKAVEISPIFWYGYEGIACAKFYQGDFEAARVAFDEGRKVAARSADRVTLDEVAAMTALAEDKPADAMQILDGIKQIPNIHPDQLLLLPVLRAVVLLHTGKTRDALAQLDTLTPLWTGDVLQPSMALWVRRYTLTVRSAVEATMKDLAPLTQTAKQIRDDAVANPDDKSAQSALHFVTGMVALANGDRTAALNEWASCSTDDTICQGYFAVHAPLSSAESASAPRPGAARPAVHGYVNARDPLFLYLRSRRPTR